MMRLPLRLHLVLCCSAFLLLPGSASAELTILPRQVRLSGPEAGHAIVVQRFEDAELREQITDDLEWTSEPRGIVRIDDQTLVPLANGTAVVTAHRGNQTATMQVSVDDFGADHRWSFRNHVQSVLTKTGCNSGACHGAAAGKNGFRLSLRGYDPEYDFLAITRHSQGRRVIPEDPARSLLLTKPSGVVPHKGGFRFRPESIEYRVLAEWIATGQAPPQLDDARIERLEMIPSQILVDAGRKQQFVVQAHFSDGRVEDVTRWAKFSSTNHTVAEIDDAGAAEITGSGEAVVGAWYLAQNATATITVPYPNELGDSVAQATAIRNRIDEEIAAKLRRLKLPASPRCTDEVFIRRLFLDTMGVLPTAEETRRFLNDTAPDKRDRLIDYALTQPAFVDYWAYQWSDLLLVSGERLRPKAVESYYDWIRQQVEQNTPWDQFAREVVTATGNTFENGAANFYALHQDPQDMAETVSMAFLGMSINCARCHDHPLEKWTNDDYYAMANLFSRVRGKGWGGDFRNGDGNRTIYSDIRGELIQPRTGRPMPPRPLDGEPISFDDPGDRREHLADWLVDPENPYFSRAVVNRVWANFMGVGLVEAVDDMRLTNPASHEDLLNFLADDLAANGYDLKSLMRNILRSETYQRSSVALPENAADERFYSHYTTRRLSAEVLLDAISQVTGVPTTFKDRPVGTTALQLPDSSVESYFLSTFGRPERIITCDCERTDDPSMVQVLHLVNGDTVLGKLSADNGRTAALASADIATEDVARELFLSALSRHPTDGELASIGGLLGEIAPEERKATIEDLYWSVLTSREFLFQH